MSHLMAGLIGSAFMALLLISLATFTPSVYYSYTDYNDTRLLALKLCRSDSAWFAAELGKWGDPLAISCENGFRYSKGFFNNKWSRSCEDIKCLEPKL